MDKSIQHKFPYEWTIKDAHFAKDKGKVMSCFACGGGSSFGYKLAGYDVIACNEIDTRVINMYLKNHNVKYSFNCDIRDLIGQINMGGARYER
jgi:DNA (cytosine-5)-methyltransferase 1